MGFDAVWITPVVQQRNGVQCIDVPGRDKVCQVPYHGFWTKTFMRSMPTLGRQRTCSPFPALKERGMGLVLDMIINHVRPIDDAADATAVRPFDKPEHYNKFGAAPGEGFASYLKHPKVCLPPPGCELGDYTCPGTTRSRCSVGGSTISLTSTTATLTSRASSRTGGATWSTSIRSMPLGSTRRRAPGLLAAFRDAVGVEVYGEVAPRTDVPRILLALFELCRSVAPMGHWPRPHQERASRRWAVPSQHLQGADQRLLR